METYGCVDCPVCGEGFEITDPNGTIPGYDYTCAEVAYGASLYALTGEQCTLLQAFLTGSGTCKCMASAPTEPPSPTISMPIEIPVESPSALPPVPPVAQPVETPSLGFALSAKSMFVSVIGFSAIITTSLVL